MNSFPRLLTAACHIACADPELALDSNKLDRMSIITHAIALSLIWVLGIIAWGIFFSAFTSDIVAFLLATLISSIIFMVDRAMGASDWELAGVLQTEKPTALFWFRLGTRIVISCILSLATATGVTLALFGKTIEVHEQEKITKANIPIEAEYTKKIMEVTGRLVLPLEHEITSLQIERNSLQQEVDASSKIAQEALKRASDARIESVRQIDGHGGRIPGRGSKAQDAERLAIEAATMAAQATAMKVAAIDRKDKQGILLNAKIAELNIANAAFKDETKEIEKAKTKDPRWISKHDDPLARYIALQELKKSEKYGDAVFYFNLIAITTLMTLELSFLSIKLLFGHASVYTVRLIARAKREAATVSAELQDYLLILQREPMKLRVEPDESQ